MSDELRTRSDAELQSLHQHVREVLAGISDELHGRTDMQQAIRRLMVADNMLTTFQEMAVIHPELMRVVLQASVAAIVNLQSAEALRRELTRRALGN